MKFLKFLWNKYKIYFIANILALASFFFLLFIFNQFMFWITLLLIYFVVTSLPFIIIKSALIIYFIHYNYKEFKKLNL